MKMLTPFLVMYWVCILATGCVAQDPIELDHDRRTPEDRERRGVGCEQNASLCNENETCTLVDPCGSLCEGEEEDALCPTVCVEIYACVETPSENESCDENMDQCPAGLSCQIDHEAGCAPSLCEDNLCTQDCVAMFTCQPTPVQPCNPQEDENTCADDEICGIARFQSVECGPNGGCPAVLPEPIFGCVPVLNENQECDMIYKDFEFDQCAEGLVCTYNANDCGVTCDENDNCYSNCPTPAPTCQPEPIQPCTPDLDENECALGEICGVVDYGPQCNENEACPDVGPYPIFRCVVELTEGEVCQEIYLGDDHCAEGLTCVVDESAGCGATDCLGEGCAECPPILTCQSVDMSQ